MPEPPICELINSLPLVIWLMRPDGSLTFINRTYLRFFDCDAATLTRDAAHWQSYLHRDDAAGYLAAFQRGLEFQQGVLCQSRVRRSDGQWRWMQSRARPHYAQNGAFVGLVGTCLDITEQHQTECELIQSRDRLKQRVDQLARLTSQLTLVEQRERQRYANLLHDHLQQDLIAAKFTLDSLIQHTTTIEQATACARALNLLDQSLATARTLNADLSPPFLHTGDFGAVLEWLARHFAQRHGLQISTELEPSVQLEREDLRILVFESVREALFNVVKHARTSQAWLTVDQDAHHRLRICVRDQGVGFVVAEQETRPTPGFGLFAMRERLSLLGGEVEISSQPGQGTAVYLLVPVDAGYLALTHPLIASSAHLPTPAPHSQALRILLVDDHILVRQGLVALLSEEHDMQVVGEASDGFEAIELAQRLQPDLILMDFSMPDLNGLEATRIIHQRWPSIRIIGLSMYEEADRAAEMCHAGADYYLSKADVSEALLEQIRAAGKH